MTGGVLRQQRCRHCGGTPIWDATHSERRCLTCFRKIEEVAMVESAIPPAPDGDAWENMLRQLEDVLTTLESQTAKAKERTVIGTERVRRLQYALGTLRGSIHLGGRQWSSERRVREAARQAARKEAKSRHAVPA